MIDRQAQKKKRKIAFGAAGFLVLAGGTPCVLWALDNARDGPDDPVGMFGVAGLGGLVLFVGVVLLYQAVKTGESTDADPDDSD